MFGLLNIDKPSGMTSRDVVNVVQRHVRPAKVGHAGTLDPLASGVLVICVGPATRLIPYVQRMPKSYRATFLLGLESDTEDVEGNVVEAVDPKRPSRDEVEQALPVFVGEIQQRPPAYSALKVAGERAYKLARQGKDVTLASRTITIHDLQLVAYDYPQMTLDIVCGSGTYVRSLGRDLAVRIGTTAVMSALVRTAVGSFRLQEAAALSVISADSIIRYLLPAPRAVDALPSLTLTAEEVRRVAHGMTIQKQPTASADEYAAIDATGQLVAILTQRGKGCLGPVRTFARAAGR